MRYYNIQAGGTQFTSVAGGANDPGALDISFDIKVKIANIEAPETAHIQVFGIPITMVSQASNYTGQNLQMSAGYTNGLPLANEQVPHQGPILSGMIFPCFGNWISNNTSIDFIVIPGNSGIGGPTSPKNIVHNMPPGTPLSTAIQNALSTAIPGAQLNINISPNLKLNYPDYSFHQSIDQYMMYCKALSHSILGTPLTTGYAGVTANVQGNNINVSDGTVKGNVTQINYDDLVGQPTWIGNNKIQVTTLMRGDINGNSGGAPLITLPPTLTTMTEASAVLASSQGGGISGLNGNYLTFQGTWNVQSLRHIGRFRDPQWNAWITIIEAVQNGTGSSGGSSNPAPSTGGVQTFTPSGAAPGSSGGIGMQ